MTGALEFVLNIQGMVNGWQKSSAAATTGVNNVAASVQKTQAHVNNATRSISRMNQVLGDLTKRRDLMVNTDSITRANRHITELQRRINHLSGVQTANGGGGSNGGVMSWALPAAGIAAVIAAGRATIMSGASAQQDLIGLTTFVGAKKAQSVYADMQRDAAATPFDTKSLLSVDRALISAGVDAQRAEKDMLGLANAISATGGGNAELARMATNMQQIKNTGKATAEDIKQFSYAGINIYQLLADATGKPLSKTKDMVVTYDLLSFALRKAAATGGLYAGAMEAQSNSIGGKWSTLVDDIGIATAKIGMSLAPQITAAIDQWIGYANSLPALAKEWTPAIMKMIEGVGNFINTLVVSIKWIYQNWYWLKYLGAGIIAVVMAYRIYNATVVISNFLTNVFNKTLFTSPAGRFVSLIFLAVAALGLFATAMTDAVDGMSDDITDSVKDAVRGNDINSAYENAGENAGKTYAKAVVKSINDYAKDKMAESVANIVAKMNKGYSTVTALASFVPPLPVNEMASDDEQIYKASPKEYVAMILKNLPANLHQAGITGGKEGFNAYVGMRRAMVRTLDASKTNLFEKIVKSEQAKLVKMANDMAKKGLNEKGDDVSGMFKGAIEEKGSSVIGGGRKQVIMNFYKELIGKQEIKVGTMREAMDWSVDEFTELMLRKLQSAKAAIS